MLALQTCLQIVGWQSTLQCAGSRNFVITLLGGHPGCLGAQAMLYPMAVFLILGFKPLSFIACYVMKTTTTNLHGPILSTSHPPSQRGGARSPPPCLTGSNLPG